MTTTWNLDRYLQLLKEKTPNNFELLFYQCCIENFVCFRHCKRYLTVIDSFLKYEITVERFIWKWCDLHSDHIRLSYKKMEEFQKLVDLSLISEAKEMGREIYWESNFAILSDEIDNIFFLIQDDFYEELHARSEYANQLSLTMYLRGLLYQRIFIFKKLTKRLP